MNRKFNVATFVNIFVVGMAALTISLFIFGGRNSETRGKKIVGERVVKTFDAKGEKTEVATLSVVEEIGSDEASEMEATETENAFPLFGEESSALDDAFVAGEIADDVLATVGDSGLDVEEVGLEETTPNVPDAEEADGLDALLAEENVGVEEPGDEPGDLDALFADAELNGGEALGLDARLADVETTPIAEEALVVEDVAPIAEEGVVVEEMAPVVELEDLDALFAEEIVVAEDFAPIAEEEVVADEMAPVAEEAVAVDEMAPVAEETVAVDEMTPVADEVVVADEAAPVAELGDLDALFAEEAVVAEDFAPIAEEGVVVDEMAPIAEEEVVADEMTPVAEEGVVVDEMAPVAELGDLDALFADEAVVAEDFAPVADEVVVEDSAPVAEEVVVVEDSAPVAEEVVVVEDSAPVADEVVVAEDSAPVAEEVVVVEDFAPVAEEGVVAEDFAPVAEEVVVAEDSAPVAEGESATLENEFWIVGQAGNGYYFYRMEQNAWVAKNADDFAATNDEFATIVYAHGYQTDMTDATQDAAVFKATLDATRKKVGSERPFRLVVWKWNSEREMARIRIDAKEKAYLADYSGKALGRLLAGLDADGDLALVGFSFGARVVGSALQTLATSGGAGDADANLTFDESDEFAFAFSGASSDDGKIVADDETIDAQTAVVAELYAGEADDAKRKIALILVSAACDLGSFEPNGVYGRGATLPTDVLNVYNPNDFALKYYRHVSETRSDAQGVAPLRAGVFPNAVGKTFNINSNSALGKRHNFVGAIGTVPSQTLGALAL